MKKVLDTYMILSDIVSYYLFNLYSKFECFLTINKKDKEVIPKIEDSFFWDPATKM